MKYFVEMSSGAMIYMTSFVKADSGIQNLIGRVHRHTESMLIS